MLIKRIRGLFAWAVIGLLIGLGVAALAGKAHAATTTQVTINSTTFTDLGAAPVMVQSLNYPVQIVVSDSLPSPSTTNIGYALYNGQPVTIPAADSSIARLCRDDRREHNDAGGDSGRGWGRWLRG